MTHIVLFHSGLGLTQHVLDFADVLRADGHEVTTPDLYDGEVFDNLADGVAKRDAIGIPELSRRGCGRRRGPAARRRLHGVLARSRVGAGAWRSCDRGRSAWC